MIGSLVRLQRGLLEFVHNLFFDDGFGASRQAQY